MGESVRGIRLKRRCSEQKREPKEKVEKEKPRT